MLQWIKQNAIQPIQLALFLALLYFAVYLPRLETLFLFAWLAFRLCKQASLSTIKKTGLLILPFVIFFAFQKLQDEGAKSSRPATLSYLEIIPDTISINGDRLSVRGRNGQETYQAFYKLQSKAEKEFFQTVSQALVLEIEAEVSAPEEQRNFRGFDYEAYLASQGIFGVVQIQSITDIQDSQNWSVGGLLSEWRRDALVHIEQTFPNPMRHYLTGLLFGYLDKDFSDMRSLYSSLGIIHLFALSGMHVTFFVQRFRWFCLRLGLRQETVSWLQLPFSLIYAGLTGFSPSVIRSLVQKQLSNYGISGLDNLGLTICVSFLLMPRFLLTAGGVLSFSYAFLLTFLQSDQVKGFKRIIIEATTLSVGILPILIWFFAVFQPLSVILTFGFSLLFDLLLLPLLCVIFLLSPFWAMAELNTVFIGLENIIQFLADLAPKPLVLGKPELWVLILLLLCLGILYDNWQKLSTRLTLMGLLFALLFMTKHPMANEITVIDVGQGDAIFLRDMKGRTVLIDVGGRVEFGIEEAWRHKQTDSNAKRTVIPYLQSRGVSRIDTLVLTHTDTDHIGDLEEVADAFAIGQVWVSPGSLTDSAFVERLAKLDLPVHRVQVGDQIPLFDQYLEVIYPWEEGDGGNNDSIVLYGRLLNTRFLFTGDLEHGELDLVSRYPQLRVDVLKAGHHGSRGSSYPEFLDHLQPQIALLSAGKNNRYQHPHTETLERFEDRGITPYRTDQQGAIRLRGWNSWEIETVN